MNLYWCHEKGEYFGLWVVAETSGKAKNLYAMETDIHFTEARCELHKKDVGNIEEGCLDLFDERLDMLGVTYGITDDMLGEDTE
jgi:hypothetical protein